MAYSDQQLKFVEVFLDVSSQNGSYREAGKAALKAANYGEHVRISHVMPYVRELVIEAFQNDLVTKIPKLLFRLEEIVDNPNIPGAKRLIDVCSTLLDRAGIVKKEESTITVKSPDGVLILPSKQTLNENIEKEE